MPGTVGTCIRVIEPIQFRVGKGPTAPAQPSTTAMRFTGTPFGATATLLSLTAGVAFAQDSSSSLPVVDLGYQLQQASEFNVRPLEFQTRMKPYVEKVH